MHNKIAQRRKELNITQQELADMIGVSVSWMNKIETGKQTPTGPMAIRIAIKLEITVSEIFFD